MPDCPRLFMPLCAAAVSIWSKTKSPDLGLFWAGCAMRSRKGEAWWAQNGGPSHFIRITTPVRRAKKTRLRSHLSTKRNRVVPKLVYASIKLKQFMNLFWAAARTMTVTGYFEYPRRFRTLQLCTKIVRCWVKRQVVFAGNCPESFSLREMRLAVSLKTFAAPQGLETSAD